MKFIIFGAGAVGCYVGARLAASGQTVALVGRPRVLEPLALSGLTVTDLDGFSAQVAPGALRLSLDFSSAWQSLAALGGSEPTVVLLCVKGAATVAAAQEMATCCPAGTPVVSLQNGVDNVARIGAAAPSLQALAGMVPYNLVMPSPTQVHRATTGSLHLVRNSLTEQMAPLWSSAGLPTVLVNDMRAVQWGKLLLNLNNPVNALSDLPLREELLNRDYRRVLSALQTEALAALDRAGITPAKVASAPPRLLPHLLKLPNWLFTRLAARMLRMDPSARSSMWDDVQLGRTTEIDDLCGAVERLAAQHGSQAPLNAAMGQLMAAHRRGQRLSGPNLRQALQL